MKWMSKGRLEKNRNTNSPHRNKKSLPKSTPVNRWGNFLMLILRKRSRRTRMISAKLDKMTVSLMHRPGRNMRQLIKTV